MKIYDCHLHLDDKLNLQEAFKQIDRGMSQANISRCLLLHLTTQPWSIDQIAAELKLFPKMCAFVNIDPKSEDRVDILDYAVNKLGFIGLKVHPRLLNHRLDDKGLMDLIEVADKNDLPVLIDAFPDGTNLLRGFSLFDYSILAQKYPKVRFIWAHMGGHHVLDFMMVAKRLHNVFFDTSYSLLYFRGSSITSDIVYAIKSMRGDRIFYGSDYPDRSLEETVKGSLEVFNQHELADNLLEKVLFKNSEMFFGW